MSNLLHALQKASHGLVFAVAGFSDPSFPGPVAPLGWFEANTEHVAGMRTAGNRAGERYVGVAMSGMEYTASGGGAIGGREYVGRMAEAMEAVSKATFR